jgi:beta-glucanase (GH16 family)
VSHFLHGTVRSIDVYDEAGRRIVARQHFDGAWNDFTEFDDDGDGTFERHVAFNRYGEPKIR